MNTTLVVMAAGMGSRFGSLKQIAPIDNDGRILLDYSVYDAKKAGFDKVVFIIKKEIEKDFREAVSGRIEKICDVDYAFQELDKLPKGFTVPTFRKKPWGTAHAALCARDKISGPFALINADDFYGRHSFELIHNHITSSSEKCMCGFKLKNTLSENGTVSRGVCDVEDGYLKGVTEYTALDKNSDIPPDTIVSMNMWGMNTDIFDVIQSEFEIFLKNHINEEKAEFYIPFVIDELIHKKNERVKVLETDEKWYGVTYKEDSETIKKAVEKMKSEGMYNGI